MNNEFLELYNKWHNTFIFSALGSANPRSKESYENLKKWCLINTKEAVDNIKEILLEEPNNVVLLLPEILNENLKIEGYMPLDIVCNIWLNVLNNDIDLNNDKKEYKEFKDYYKNYREFHEYMKDHYISWNPNNEENPNITFEEFKQGKRNKYE